jgi:hypothetical protein
MELLRDLLPKLQAAGVPPAARLDFSRRFRL